MREFSLREKIYIAKNYKKIPYEDMAINLGTTTSSVKTGIHMMIQKGELEEYTNMSEEEVKKILNKNKGRPKNKEAEKQTEKTSTNTSGDTSEINDGVCLGKYFSKTEEEKTEAVKISIEAEEYAELKYCKGFLHGVLYQQKINSKE